jgi:hypothetical protein
LLLTEEGARPWFCWTHDEDLKGSAEIEVFDLVEVYSPYYLPPPLSWVSRPHPPCSPAWLAFRNLTSQGKRYVRFGVAAAIGRSCPKISVPRLQYMVLVEELLFKIAKDVSIRVVDETLQHRSDVTNGKTAVLINSGSEPT